MNLQRAFTGIRANKWWHFKVNIFVAFILLASLSIAEQPNAKHWLLCLLFLFALLPGATYVSLINDLTDYHQDRIAHKVSGIDLIGKKRSIALIILSISLGILLTLFLPITLTAKLLYAAAWIAFSCYSIPPIRLKNRGIWGVMADASGAHLFPILFLFAAIQQHQFQATTAVLIGLNVVCFGLRGILWHQFSDKQNDLNAGVVTLVTTYNNAKIKRTAKGLLMVECITLITYFIIQQHYFLLLALAMYGTYVFLLHRFLRLQVVVSASQPNSSWTFIMGIFYQFFLPLSLLLYYSVHNPLLLLAIPIFLWLFPVITNQIKQQLKQFIQLLQQ